MATRPPPCMTSSICKSSPLVSRAVLRKRMRAPVGGLSIVSPALAMVLLPFPRIDIMLPNVVRCMLRNPYSPKCVEEEFSEVRLVQLSKNTRVGDAYPSLLYYGALIISRSRLGMRIAVIGAGGTGGYFGGLLAQAGEEVTFIARGAQLEALHRRGLTLESRLAGTFTIPVRATDDPSEICPVDLVLC